MKDQQTNQNFLNNLNIVYKNKLRDDGLGPHIQNEESIGRRDKDSPYRASNLSPDS